MSRYEFIFEKDGKNYLCAYGHDHAIGVFLDIYVEDENGSLSYPDSDTVVVEECFLFTGLTGEKFIEIIKEWGVDTYFNARQLLAIQRGEVF